MPSLAIVRTAGGYVPEAPQRGAHPKAQLVSERGLRLVLPFAPAGADLGGMAATFSTQDRPGRRALVLRDGVGLPTLRHDYLLARSHHQSSVEDLLAQLRAIAEAGDRITLVNLSVSERGPWRIGNLTVTVLLRQHGTNAITRAAVSLDYLAASDARPRLGPVTGGAATPVKGITTARHYTLKAGDTLRKLAARFYGEPDEWRRIARRNKLRTPDRLPVGRRIVIPPDDED